MTWLDDEIPPDVGEHVRSLTRPELKVLGLLEATAVAFRALPGLTPDDLEWGERYLQESRRRILARPALEAYAHRLRSCDDPAGQRR